MAIFNSYVSLPEGMFHVDNSAILQSPWFLETQPLRCSATFWAQGGYSSRKASPHLKYQGFRVEMAKPGGLADPEVETEQQWQWLLFWHPITPMSQTQCVTPKQTACTVHLSSPTMCFSWFHMDKVCIKSSAVVPFSRWRHCGLQILRIQSTKIQWFQLPGWNYQL